MSAREDRYLRITKEYYCSAITELGLERSYFSIESWELKRKDVFVNNPVMALIRRGGGKRRRRRRGGGGGEGEGGKNEGD